MKRALATGIALVLLASCGSRSGVEAEPVAETADVPGSVIATNVLAIAEEATSGTVTTSCEEMAALRSLDQAQLFNADGERVATAELEPSAHYANDPKLCVWDFTFEDVEVASDSYSVSVGDWTSESRSKEDATSKGIHLDASG